MYVDTSVMMGMTGDYNGSGFDGIEYMVRLATLCLMGPCLPRQPVEGGAGGTARRQCRSNSTGVYMLLRGDLLCGRHTRPVGRLHSLHAAHNHMAADMMPGSQVPESAPF